MKINEENYIKKGRFMLQLFCLNTLTSHDIQTVCLQSELKISLAVWTHKYRDMHEFDSEVAFCPHIQSHSLSRQTRGSAQCTEKCLT